MPQDPIDDKYKLVRSVWVVRQHAITWTNVDPEPFRYMASIGHWINWLNCHEIWFGWITNQNWFLKATRCDGYHWNHDSNIRHSHILRIRNRSNGYYHVLRERIFAMWYNMQYSICEERTHLSLRVADIVIQLINQANSVCEPFDFWFGVQ